MTKVKTKVLVVLLVQSIAVVTLWFWTKDSGTDLKVGDSARELNYELWTRDTSRVLNLQDDDGTKTIREEVTERNEEGESHSWLRVSEYGQESSYVNHEGSQSEQHDSPSYVNDNQEVVVSVESEQNETYNQETLIMNSIQNGKSVPGNARELGADQEELYVARYLRQRRELIKTTCERLHPSCSLNSPLVSRNYYFHNYSTTVCTIAKAGSSTWRAHLRRINKGPPSHLPIFQDPLRDEFLARPRPDVIRDIQASAKIITVRHPLTRLVSCYRQKYKDGKKLPYHHTNLEKLYHKTHAGAYWSDKVHQFWVPALHNNGLIPHDLHLRLGLQQPFDPKTKYTTEVYEKLQKILQPRISFTQFLRHVIVTYRDNKPDAHWADYNSQCCPCYFDYAYVTKVETLTEDLQYVFRVLGLPSDPSVSMNQLRRNLDKPYSDFWYYRKVPVYLKRQIYEIFKLDLEMFGYQLPQNFLPDD
ncbi:carbohydrate sulfotransferase 11-like [Homarus americanus]|uniref:carbohydrate sulfotransferase 11-like n=1 Tax=Homarus americanus TaxID=6706 RepID=UPI001C43C5F6|nr:carbohydrate sulfotransferase 11-like [Homarus americanus]